MRTAYDIIRRPVITEASMALTANIAFAGFTAPKVLWVKENEPENFAKIAKIMLPKDYINYILTGVHCCGYSDASGMLLLDVQNKCWSAEMLKICGITEAQMPGLYESFECIGTVKPEIAKAVETAFGVKVADVNTINMKKKPKRLGYHQGYTSEWKKAIVTLKPDSKTIEFFDGMM